MRDAGDDDAAAVDRSIRLPRCHFLFNGLGAGNIGDEAMFAGFNELFHMQPDSTIEVADATAPIVQTLPDAFRYVTWTDFAATDAALRAADVVLLVGDTLVSELHGPDWPLRAIGKRVGRAIELGKTVHGVAIGVDRLTTSAARDVFWQYHAHLATWTTRSDDCRDALIELGVSPDRIAVAADLAWACPEDDGHDGGEDQLGEGLFVGINAIGEDWAANDGRTRALASALDAAARTCGVRFAFFYNETRRHPVYDYDTAERIAALMRSQPLLAEPRYVTPTQQIACIRRCKAIVSQRYHFGLMGVLAERPVGLFRRGQKLEQLLSEIEAPNLGPHDVIDEERVIAGVRELIENGDDVLQRQQAARQRLTRRLIENAGHYLRRPG